MAKDRAAPGSTYQPLSSLLNVSRPPASRPEMAILSIIEWLLPLFPMVT